MTKPCERATCPPTQNMSFSLPFGKQNPQLEKNHSAGWWPEAREDIKLRGVECDVHLEDTAPAQLENCLRSTKSIPTLIST